MPAAAPHTQERISNLVLSRSVEESIVITDPRSPFGELVRIKLVRAANSRARFHFAAPTSVGIHRAEEYDACRRRGPRPDPSLNFERVMQTVRGPACRVLTEVFVGPAAIVGDGRSTKLTSRPTSPLAPVRVPVVGGAR